MKCHLLFRKKKSVVPILHSVFCSPKLTTPDQTFSDTRKKRTPQAANSESKVMRTC